jgi:hypothetical protein
MTTVSPLSVGPTITDGNTTTGTNATWTYPYLYWPNVTPTLHFWPRYFPVLEACPSCGYCPHCGRSGKTVKRKKKA